MSPALEFTGNIISSLVQTALAIPPIIHQGLTVMFSMVSLQFTEKADSLNPLMICGTTRDCSSSESSVGMLIMILSSSI